MSDKRPQIHPFRSELHYWQGLARALHQGQEGNPHAGISPRPALPSELVLQILRYIGALKPVHSPQLSFKWRYQPPAERNEDENYHAYTKYASVTADSSTCETRLVFASPPLDAAMLSRLAGVQVSTTSKDQGWCRYVVYLFNPKSSAKPIDLALQVLVLGAGFVSVSWSLSCLNSNRYP